MTASFNNGYYKWLLNTISENENENNVLHNLRRTNTESKTSFKLYLLPKHQIFELKTNFTEPVDRQDPSNIFYANNFIRHTNLHKLLGLMFPFVCHGRDCPCKGL